MRNSRDAHPSMSIERMANAAAAVERIAVSNKLLLEHNYNTTCGDVIALVSLAKAKWYEQNGRR